MAHRAELPRWRVRAVHLRAVPGDRAQDLLQGPDRAAQGDRPAHQAHQRDGAGHACRQDVRMGDDHRGQARRGARQGAEARAQAALHVRLPLRLHDHAAPLPHRLDLLGLRRQRQAARGQHCAPRPGAALAAADAHRIPADDHHAAAQPQGGHRPHHQVFDERGALGRDQGAQPRGRGLLQGVPIVSCVLELPDRALHLPWRDPLRDPRHGRGDELDASKRLRWSGCRARPGLLRLDRGC
eukprot:scaffold31877_cov66-Phaeocystis_antarctica.AAC.2